MHFFLALYLFTLIITFVIHSLDSTVTCLKLPLKKKTKLVFKTNYRLMQVKSIAEAAILLTFIKLLLVIKIFVSALLECHLRQVLLYNSLTCHIQSSLFQLASDVVGNSEDRFSCFEAKLLWHIQIIFGHGDVSNCRAGTLLLPSVCSNVLLMVTQMYLT